ncbi:hypothetical protein J4N46_07980 [Capnocytophaga sp. Marseille-Q4570]|uniref:Inactive Receiver domain-containing protein n=1 Tax=Capnocytophaga bilenii TaxID=2819369 RepID=A0ABS3PYG8_9FLAO|nr:hypothetical protein [Capnocytophaga bilenii]MBO1884360.1 hypothetical protein [Capnocytophaga bilenii]
MMIYLIDEQINRQIEYGWTKERFVQYNTIVKTIHKKEEFSEDILNKGDIIFLHESFPDENIKNQIYDYWREEKKISIGVFSGSKNERKRREGRIDLPVSVFYSNLAIFLLKIKGGTLNINYLLYGESPELEKALYDELNIRNRNNTGDSIKSNCQNLIFFTSEDYINNPFDNPFEITLYGQEGSFSDERLHNILTKELNGKRCDNVFIPLCFGNSLSDYNGLRLASHIRCTETPIQLSNIYIYGFVGYEKLLAHPCFNILKTKNVKLIDYSVEAIQKIDKDELLSSLEKSDLPNEIKKLALVSPKDNHSITNEWAVYRWATTINTNDDDIEIIAKNIENSLYFKYLKTIYPITKSKELSSIKIEKNNKNPKILYIDDEAEKGWNEIFATILYDNNELNYISLDIDYKTLSKNEIISSSIQKIKEDNTDIVILDFRLHSSDFSKNVPIQEVTSVQILKAIKEYNAGIQVIIFSATNKIWNLQTLESSGADGFIIKEAPENSVDPNFTQDTINNFQKVMEKSIRMTFLKEAYSIMNEIKIYLEKKGSNKKENELKNEIILQLETAFECLKKTESNNYFKLSYISLFKIIELITIFYVEGRFLKKGKNITPIEWYNEKKECFEEYKDDKDISTKSKIIYIYNHLGGDVKNIFSEISTICEKRNNIIHPESIRKQNIVEEQENIMLLNTIYTIIKVI